MELLQRWRNDYIVDSDSKNLEIEQQIMKYEKHFYPNIYVTFAEFLKFH